MPSPPCRYVDKRFLARPPSVATPQRLQDWLWDALTRGDVKAGTWGGGRLLWLVAVAPGSGRSAAPAEPALRLFCCSLPRHCMRRRRQRLVLGPGRGAAGVGKQHGGRRRRRPAAVAHQPGPLLRAARRVPGAQRRRRGGDRRRQGRVTSLAAVHARPTIACRRMPRLTTPPLRTPWPCRRATRWRQSYCCRLAPTSTQSRCGGVVRRPCCCPGRAVAGLVSAAVQPTVPHAVCTHPAPLQVMRRTPLHYAVLYDQAELAKHLLRCALRDGVAVAAPVRAGPSCSIRPCRPSLAPHPLCQLLDIYALPHLPPASGAARPARATATASPLRSWRRGALAAATASWPRCSARTRSEAWQVCHAVTCKRVRACKMEAPPSEQQRACRLVGGWAHGGTDRFELWV